jgi:hypothetical protein
MQRHPRPTLRINETPLGSFALEPGSIPRIA